MSWQEQAIELAKQGMSWRNVARELDVPRTTVSDFLRKEFKQKQVDASPTEQFSIRKQDVQKEDNSRVLLISDMHSPPHTLVSNTCILCYFLGVDNNFSYHDQTRLPIDELRRSIPIIHQLHEMFPKMDLITDQCGVRQRPEQTIH